MNLVLLLSLFVTFTAHAAADKIHKLTILHTNDHHGRFWPNSDGELGLAARSTLIQQLRAEAKKDGSHVLLLDAGDVNTGIPQSDILKAEPDFKGMAALKYDVMALGNHEFDNPVATIFKQREWAGFPFVSANIYYDKTNERVFPSHIVKNLDGLRVAIFGLTTEDTPLKTKIENTKGLKFRPAVQEAKELVPTLRKEADIVIAVTHIGHHPDESHGIDAPGDVTLARQVNGIDLIVGGHTQKPLFEPDIQNNTIIVQAYEWGKYVGKVELEIVDGKAKLLSYKLIPVNLKDSPEKFAQDPQLEILLRPFKAKGEEELMVKLGTSDVEFIGRRDVIRHQETNLGNLVARSYREKLQADVGIVNAGGMRDSIYPGKITLETVLTVLPFGGAIVKANLTGKELKVYLEKVLANLTPGSGSFPQTDNLDISANSATRKMTKALVGGKPIDEAKMYSVALPEFIAAGGDKYPILKYENDGTTDAEALKDFILKVKRLRKDDFAPRQSIRFEQVEQTDPV